MTDDTAPGTTPTTPKVELHTRVAGEVRVIGMVWERELIRYVRTRTRILSGLIQPVLFLFVLGYGMSGLVGTVGGFNFHQFVYPGVVAMSVVMTAMFSALSIVWDREFGFLREMLIAPVSTDPGPGQNGRRCLGGGGAGDDHAGAGPAGRHPPHAVVGSADDLP